MMDKSKLSLNARLGVKMGACWMWDESHDEGWVVSAHDEEVVLMATIELGLFYLYENASSPRRFDSDDAPRSLLHGPDGLLDAVYCAHKWPEFLAALGLDPDETTLGLTFDVATWAAAEIAKAADAVLPWPEGI